MTNSKPSELEKAQIKLRITARALGRSGLAHAYGHCSCRLDDRTFLVCAPHAMGTIKPEEEGTISPIEGPLPPGVLGEVRIHQQLYRLNPGTQAVCRIMPPSVMTLSTLGISPRPRHGIGAYFGDNIPFWSNPRLLRDDDSAYQLAQLMSDSPALIMRGNGAVVVGETLEQALTFSWFLEDAARIELAIRSLSVPAEEGLLSSAEIHDRQITTGKVFERMWRYLTDGDPELDMGY